MIAYGRIAQLDPIVYINDLELIFSVRILSLSFLYLYYRPKSHLKASTMNSVGSPQFRCRGRVHLRYLLRPMWYSSMQIPPFSQTTLPPETIGTKRPSPYQREPLPRQNSSRHSDWRRRCTFYLLPQNTGEINRPEKRTNLPGSFPKLPRMKRY